MKLEKGKISHIQLMFSLVIFIQGALFTIRFSYAVMYRDIWFFAIVSLLISLIFVLLYVKIMSLFPGKTIITINDLVFGAVLGKVISILYLMFFIIVAISNIRIVSDYMVGTFMTRTPYMAFAVLFVLVCMWAVYCGIETIGRLSLIFFVIVSAALISILLMVSNNADFKNFLPILDVNLIDSVHVIHGFCTIFYGEVFIFMMIAPYVTDRTKIKKALVLGLVIGAVSLIFTALMITAVLDKFALISYNPIIETVRQIELKGIVPRIEIIAMGANLFSVFMRISILYYVIVLGIGQLLKLRSYKILVLPVGVLMIALTIPLYENAIEQGEVGSLYWPFLASIILFIFPILTLITTAIRGQTKNGEEDAV